MRVIPRQVRRLKLPRPSTVLAILIAVSGTVVAGYLISQRMMLPPHPTAPRTATVTRGSIRATVNARGTVASLEPSHVNFPGSGTIDEVAVQVGDRVRAGQELAQMDSVVLRSALEQAEAKLDAERAKLQLMLKMLSGPRPEDVTAANAELEGAQAKLEGVAYARPEDMQSAEAAVEAANLKLQKLFQPEGADVAAAQSSLDSAMAQLAMDEARLQAAQSQVASDLASASAEVTSARSALQSAQQKLNLLLEPDPAGLEEGDVVQVPTAPVRTAVPSASVGSPDAPGGPSLFARF